MLSVWLHGLGYILVTSFLIAPNLLAISVCLLSKLILSALEFHINKIMQ